MITIMSKAILLLLLSSVFLYAQKNIAGTGLIVDNTNKLTAPGGLVSGSLPTATQSGIQHGGYLYCADSESTDTYLCGLTPALTAYTTGMIVIFKPNTTNTGAATLNIDSLGVKNIVTASNTTLGDNDLTANRLYTLFYDGTSFRMHQDNSGTGGGYSTSDALASDLSDEVGTSGGFVRSSVLGNYTLVSFSTTPTFTATSRTSDSFTITLTDNVTSSTLSTPTTGQLLNFRICQDATGGRTFVWPTGFTGALIPSLTASACTIQSFFWDGTDAILTGGSLDGVTAMAETAAPSGNPPSNYYYSWADSTDHIIHSKDSSGNVNSHVRTTSSRTANQFVTHIASTGIPSTAAIVDDDIPNNITISLAATATALASNPTDCSANQFATTIAVNGNLTCSSIADADIPDTITVSNYLPLSGGTLTSQLITDNLGIEFDESDTNPTCAAGNYSIYADLSETKLKKCINGSATDLDTTGGTPSFDTITGGTNTTAAMIIGTGGSLAVTGTGTIEANLAPTESYDATNWNGDTAPPQKDAIRDKIETLPNTGSCTNQVVTALNAATTPTCTTVTGSHMANNTVTSTQLATAQKTDMKSLTLFDPVTGDSGRIQIYFGQDVTITRVACSVKAATSVTINLEERAEATPDTAGTAVLTSNLVCDTNSESSITFSNASIASRVPLALTIIAVSGTPDTLRVHVEYTKN